MRLWPICKAGGDRRVKSIGCPNPLFGIIGDACGDFSKELTMRQTSPSVSKTQAADLGVIQSLYDKGEFRKVVLRAQKALKTHPGHVGLHALAGFSAQQLGDDRTAEALLSKAAQLAQTEGSASVELPLGRANWAPCAGCAALCGVPEKTPTYAAALNGLGRSLLALGEVQNAIVLLGDALKSAAN